MGTVEVVRAWILAMSDLDPLLLALAWISCCYLRLKSHPVNLGLDPFHLSAARISFY